MRLTVLKIYVISIFTLLSCVSIKPKADNVYTIINIMEEEIVKYNEKYDKQDYIYLNKKSRNTYFSGLLKNDLKKLIKNDDEYHNIFKESDIEHLIKQLETSFLIDFKKLKSTNIKEYIDTFKRLDSLGNYIVDDYFLNESLRVKYTFSRPVFTLNNEYGFILFSNNDIISISVFIKEKNQWKFYRYIPIAIVN